MEAPAKHAAVAPRSELRTQRTANANELGAVSKTGKPHVIRLRAQALGAEFAFALLDGFPALLDRREIPARAVRADDPQPSFVRIERQASPDWEVLDGLVLAEGLMAVQARGVHVGVNMERCLTP